jgi:NRPS condensation-like uncharacterized protein
MYRQLGTSERTVSLYSQVRPNHFTLTANILGALHLEGLQQALIKVQQRHPLLNVRIALDRQEIPWVIKDIGIIPVRLIERHSPQQWQQEVERELANPFDWNQAPLVRVVLLQGVDVSDLIITCDHTISDGISVVFLLRDILQALESPDRPLGDLPERESYEKLVTQFEQRLQPLSLFEPSLVSTKTKPTLPEKSRPRLHTWSLSAVETNEIVTSCQQAQTSVYTAICAALLMAIAKERVQNHDLEEFTHLKCLSPINVRRFLPEIEADFGHYFVYTLIAESIAPDRSLWELARSIRAKLNQKIDPTQIFSHIPDSEAFISTLPRPDDVVAMMETFNKYDVLVSNLGRLTIPQQYGEFELAAIYGPSATTHVDRDLVVGVMTLGDRMFFSLVYSGSDFSSAQIEQLQQTAMQSILSMSQSSK